MQCRRGPAMRILSVFLSVRLSVKRVICDKMEERSVQIFIPYEIPFSLVFSEEEVSQFQSSTFSENYNAPCSAVSL